MARREAMDGSVVAASYRHPNFGPAARGDVAARAKVCVRGQSRLRRHPRDLLRIDPGRPDRARLARDHEDCGRERQRDEGASSPAAVPKAIARTSPIQTRTNSRRTASASVAANGATSAAGIIPRGGNCSDRGCPAIAVRHYAQGDHHRAVARPYQAERQLRAAQRVAASDLRKCSHARSQTPRCSALHRATITTSASWRMQEPTT
jgi:hypothetical protein